jgi:hypothetical protein
VREQRRSAVSDRDVATVAAFNEAINARDLDALVVCC